MYLLTVALEQIMVGHIVFMFHDLGVWNSCSNISLFEMQLTERHQGTHKYKQDLCFISNLEKWPFGVCRAALTGGPFFRARAYVGT